MILTMIKKGGAV